MTSSFAHVPRGSIPYTQHFHVRKPGFGEIRLDTNNNALYPSLVRYVDSLVLGQTLLLKSQATIIPYTVAGSNVITWKQLLGGLVTANGSATSPLVFNITDFTQAFKEQFGRDPKPGDSFVTTIVNNTASVINFIANTGSLPQIRPVAVGKTVTVAYYFSSDVTLVGVLPIGEFTT
jgi:hypothetical protein